MITNSSSGELHQLGDTTTTQDFTFNIGTPTNGLLVVQIVMLTAVARSISSITWNGTTVDFVQYAHTGGAPEGPYRLATGWLSNPATGSNTLTVTTATALGATESMSVYWSAWNGAHQTQASVKDTDASTSVSSTAVAVDITPTVDNCLVVAHYITDLNAPITMDAWGTEANNHDYGGQASGAGYVIQTTAGLVTCGWTGGTANDASIQAVSFKEASGGGGGGGEWYAPSMALMGVGR